MTDPFPPLRFPSPPRLTHRNQEALRGLGEGDITIIEGNSLLIYALRAAGYDSLSAYGCRPGAVPPAAAFRPLLFIEQTERLLLKMTEAGGASVCVVFFRCLDSLLDVCPPLALARDSMKEHLRAVAELEGSKIEVRSWA